MPSVRIFAPGRAEVDRGLLVGRVDGFEDAQQPIPPAQVGLLEMGLAWARDSDAAGRSWRPGKVTDVKPNLHWILEPVHGGGYQLRPVHGWFEFAIPQLEGGKASGSGAGAPKAVAAAKDENAGEQEIKDAGKLRHKQAEKWEAMVKKRNERGGMTLKIGDGAAALYPDRERLDDDTGIRQQSKKRRKQQQRSGENVEDEDAPDTANGMLSLKRESGENGWDFADEDQFSDDEHDNFEFDKADDGLGDAVAAGDEDAPSADEGAEEDAEGGTVLGSHGQAIQNLLSKPEEMVGDAEGDDEEEEEE